MKIFPKLNIFLNILPPLEGGMHPLFSRFVLAYGELYDEMEILEGVKNFEIKGEFSCPMQANLIYKAKEALKREFPMHCTYFESLRVEVQKNIPQGAGLGGGSADAGAFLCEMARRLQLPKDILKNIAPTIGSDVSFFVNEFESANVMGSGEIVQEFTENTHYTYEIFTPEIFCNTAKVYQAFDFLLQNQKIQSVPKVDFLNLSSIELLSRFSPLELNDLFIPALSLYPQLEVMSKDLGEGWFFSGSGSSFFRVKGLG
ncbi:4-(cytidine 5'-diphospho)-2-C-methyl-D-erythritol kinase [Helicobacter cholecystus]|uniref:4-(cytidine 5'-diphospho)-2-C-methyl-D-erythritol kinase n=2 Tax=Helicobacter cholecystus TaxID=45498 RepID=A0A3D8IUX2_9HELI|nr:4-(cytidine 5'-diphospho)-2-C-methyl-D-erythritol kinase [Helicobacter cholecystus]RDU68803.1 4-(cytidine 5'-diphospho)-2-C-methyl-D-erythritol kinase [Helicobacter cholecystus]VEJ23919.1 4-diphosphocytidyl-2-C-methyl-D-erythritol kinase [Helicobacter cholecystus]